MLHGFATDDEALARAALLVHGVYRARNKVTLKTTFGMWGVVERAVKSSAKRAGSLGEFVEKLKPKIGCGALRPMVRSSTGEEVRDFWVEVLTGVWAPLVLERLYKETTLVVALVRDRLERERADRALVHE